MPRFSPTMVPATPVSIAQAAALVADGDVCAFPTETVYGLGADATQEAAVLRIYELKGRPRRNPLIVHVPDVAWAMRVCAAFPPLASRLAERHWPGPLSLVLPRGAHIPDIVSAGLPSVAVRVPAHPVALSLLRAARRPLAAPSANRSESVSPTTAEHVLRSLPGVPLILDGGPCPLGIESTVLDLTQPRPRLLRPGALPLRDLLSDVPDLELPSCHFDEVPGPLPSPGLLTRHYAPKATLHLVSNPEARFVAGLPSPTGLLTHAPLPQLDGLCDVVERLPATPEAYAVDLYAALHRLDDQGMRSIVVLAPPRNEDWRAILDRLERAASKAA